MKLDSLDHRLARGVCKELGRPVLHQVMVRKGELAVADGFLLVRREGDFTPDDTLRDTEVGLPASILKTVRMGERESAEVVLSEDKTRFTLTVQDEKGKAKEPVLTFSALRDVYPAFEHIAPSALKKAEVAVDIKLLRKLLSCLPDDGYLRMGLGEKSEPVEFYITSWSVSAKERPYRALLMPIFCSWDEHKWLKDLKPAKPIEGAAKEQSTERPAA